MTETGFVPALSKTLRAVGCHVMTPTRFECPSRTTTGSDKGVTRPFSGICQTFGEQKHCVHQRIKEKNKDTKKLNKYIMLREKKTHKPMQKAVTKKDRKGAAVTCSSLTLQQGY